jgi:hypothetical protein
MTGQPLPILGAAAALLAGAVAPIPELSLHHPGRLGGRADASWRHVEPHIFGSLLEGALGHDTQWALGAHYTYARISRR